MKLNVKLVGLTSGFSVGVLGPTHECITDLAIMQALPNITILSPADGIETVKAVMAAAEIDDPVYLRLTGSMNSPIVYKNDFDYQVGKAIELREGKEFMPEFSVLYEDRSIFDATELSERLTRHTRSIA